MSKQMEIDTRGAREMFAALQRKTGMTYRDVVRGISAEILTAAAKRTKTTKPAKVMQSVEKNLRKPMNIDGKLIGRMKNGRIWYSGRGWNRSKKNFVLLSASGRPNVNITKASKEVPGVQAGKTRQSGKKRKPRNPPIQLSGKLLGEINRTIQIANRRRQEDLKRKKAALGSSKAVWLEIMRQLAMRPTSTEGLKQALKAKLHPNNRAAVSGRESGQGEQFEIEIRNQSRSSLAPKSGDGLNAFRFALRGKVKQFQTAAKKDLETYARRFAQRHGFDVS